MKKQPLSITGIRFAISEKNEELARGYLYLLKNDLHERPYAFIEDLYVAEAERGAGYGSKMLQAMIEEAKKRGCYKIIATSRKPRRAVHRFYEKNGFQKWGYEFRIDLK